MLKNKKFLAFVLAFAMVLVLASCGNNKPAPRTYVADGEYTAFTIEGVTKPEVTSATVTIKNDKLVAVKFNTTQSNTLKNEDGSTKGYEFKAQSKQELGYAYHMHYKTYTGSLAEGEAASEEGYKAWLKANNKLEWFEQVAIIADAIVANGVESIELADGKFANLAGVTIKDNSYVALAAEAIANAKAGKKVAYATHEDDLIIATANVNAEGKLSNIVIDTVQGQFSNGAWSFKAQSKQELGYGYHMHYRSYTGSLAEGETASEEGYKAWLKANNKLEWHEQAALIVSAWEANHNLTATEGKFPNVAGVTIADNQYITVLNGLLK